MGKIMALVGGLGTMFSALTFELGDPVWGPKTKTAVILALIAVAGLYKDWLDDERERKRRRKTWQK